MKIKVLVVEPLKAPYEKEIDIGLKSMQALVGGYIQAIYPFEDNTALICNEEGKITGLPLNRAITDQDGKIYDIVAGTFFLCSAPADSDEFASLSEEKIQKYKERFKNIELYIPK